MSGIKREYGIFRGKPFVGKTWGGKPVILAEETTFEANKGRSIDAIYTIEVVINTDPSPAEVFKVRLANPNE